MAHKIHTHPLAATAAAAAAFMALAGSASYAPHARAQTAGAPAVAAAPAAAASQSGATQLAPVTVTGRATPALDVSGWGDIPLARTPLQASVYGSELLRDNGASRISDLVSLDPAVSDAYNSIGYWDFLTVRGYVVDNQYNFRRDGLPINAETSIPLDNKARVEILKGTSGIQAGTSAPGGLVNLVVKRPLDAPLRSARLAWEETGSVLAATDLSQRFGADHAFGARLNVAAEHLDPMLRAAKGNRYLVALAGDWRLAPGSLLEAEVERSHRSQPSQPGFSMLGATLPAPTDPRINLNNQPWSLPVVMDATTGSLRWRQRLSDDWQFVAHAGMQRLESDDRLAYPFGCSKESNYDRYCSDGTYDYYAFRSDGERRRTTSLDLHAEGRLQTGALAHRLSFGALGSRYESRFNPRLDDGVIVGSGSVDGLTIVPTLPPLDSIPQTNLTERSTELYLRDTIDLTPTLAAWLGVRHTRIRRDSETTDGASAAGYAQTFTAPSIALSYTYAPDQLVYASWGQGVESELTPNKAQFANAGQPLPALKSRQIEVGIKGGTQDLEWSAAWFDIKRPAFGDACVVDDCSELEHRRDGEDNRRGIEATGSWHAGAWTLGAGAQWLRARRSGSTITPAANGMQPTNVPARTLKMQLGYDVGAVPGLHIEGRGVYESERQVLPDNSVQVPGYTRFDAFGRYDYTSGGVRSVWRVGVSNLFDKRAWRESPYQYGHVYLFPLEARTFRASVDVEF